MAHTANGGSRDELISHQIQLLRFWKGMASRMGALLNRAEPELRSRLKGRLDRIAALGFDPGPATTRRLIKTSQLIAEINKPTFDEINRLVRTELVGLSIAETQFIAGVITEALPVIFEPTLPTPKDLRGIVFARPFEKRILRDWLGTYQLGDRRRMMSEIRQGLVFGENPTQIGGRIVGTRALGGPDGVRAGTPPGAQSPPPTPTGNDLTKRQNVSPPTADSPAKPTAKTPAHWAFKTSRFPPSKATRSPSSCKTRAYTNNCANGAPGSKASSPPSNAPSD